MAVALLGRHEVCGSHRWEGRSPILLLKDLEHSLTQVCSPLWVLLRWLCPRRRSTVDLYMCGCPCTIWVLLHHLGAGPRCFLASPELWRQCVAWVMLWELQTCGMPGSFLKVEMKRECLGYKVSILLTARFCDGKASAFPSGERRSASSTIVNRNMRSHKDGQNQRRVGS
ncbi:unnamed protein product [Ostreobium quekettii]|uniref:Uncharacterized protein n=1 Tax=Ostreobium quekettii TaxID=121088 RepID=A0A8S1ITY9_9CHLO|nr:unnamed protein product [Ostreobium quekettii]CAD7701635.1 unnamed protein product [Ostreobium quekettii]